LQQTGTNTIRFYANIESWRVLSQSQRRDKQIQNIWLLKMILLHFSFVWFYMVCLFRTSFEHLFLNYNNHLFDC
jgi:hypothetical protein